MKGTINIIGEIGVDVTLEDVKSQYEKQPKAKYFNVNIDSVGGCLFTGLEIFDFLMESKAHIHTIGRSMVASVASLIFIAGDTRQVSYGTSFDIHLPFVAELTNANSKDLNEMAQQMEKLDLIIASIYMNRTKVKRNEIFKMLEDETSLTGSELYRLGFVTEEPTKLAAILTIKNDKKMSRRKSKGVLHSLRKFLTEHDVVVENKVLYTANRDEVEFPNLDEDGVVTEGEEVRLNGEVPADETEITLADGRKILVMGGKVSSITEVSNELDEEEIEEDLEALEEEVEALKEKVEVVEEEVEELKIENKKLKSEKADAEKKLASAIKMMREIDEIGSKVLNKGVRQRKGSGATKRPFEGAIKKLNY